MLSSHVPHRIAGTSSFLPLIPLSVKDKIGSPACTCLLQICRGGIPHISKNCLWSACCLCMIPALVNSYPLLHLLDCFPGQCSPRLTAPSHRLSLSYFLLTDPAPLAISTTPHTRRSLSVQILEASLPDSCAVLHTKIGKPICLNINSDKICSEFVVHDRVSKLYDLFRVASDLNVDYA